MSKNMNRDISGRIDLGEIDFGSSSSSNTQDFTSQVESVLSATKSIEANLNKERAYAKQLRDYAERITERCKRAERAEATLKEQLHSIKRNENGNDQKIQELTNEYNKIKAELEHYREAWAGVLRREKEAKTIMSELEELRRIREDQDTQMRNANETISIERSKRQQAERATEALKNDIQSLNFQLQTAETRYHELSSEIEALHNMKKNLQQGMAQQERVLRQTFEAERATQKQQMRAEIEQERKRLLDEIAEIRKERDRVQIQVETQYANEVAKIKTEFSKCIATETAKVEEKYSKMAAQKDEVISNMTANLRTIENELAFSRKELEKSQKDSDAELSRLKQQMLSTELNASMEISKIQEQLNAARKGAETDAAIMKQQVATIERAAEEEKKKILRQYLSELGPREAMITALRSEAQQLRELLISESKKLHELVDQILAEIAANKIEDMFDEVFLMYLKELQLAEPVHKRIQPTRMVMPPPPPSAAQSAENTSQ